MRCVAFRHIGVRAGTQAAPANVSAWNVKKDKACNPAQGFPALKSCQKPALAKSRLLLQNA